MKIKYCFGKKNPADKPFWRSDYIDAANNKEERTLHIVDYVTWGSIKHGETQKAIENTHQATQQSEVTSEANMPESYLTDNESLLYNTVDDRVEILLSEKSDMPDSDPIKIRKTFSKRKRKESTKQAKKVLPKGKKKKKLDEILLDSQPIKLRLITCDDKMAHVNREIAKNIFKKESTFASPSLKMHQVLQALQEADHFAQTMKLCAIKVGPLAPQWEGEEKMPMSVKSGEFKRTMMWHVEDKLLCYKQRWYIPLRFLHWELLRQHYNDLWAGHFGPCRILD